MVLFGSLVLSMVIGIGVGYWCLRGSLCLGRDHFAYGPVNFFTWLACGFYEVIVSGALFANVFLLNSLIDLLAGSLSDHLFSDIFISTFVAQALVFAMIVEGARHRRHYYTLFVPWRRSYRSFPKGSIIRPPFRVLYPLW